MHLENSLTKMYENAFRNIKRRVAIYRHPRFYGTRPPYHLRQAGFGKIFGYLIIAAAAGGAITYAKYNTICHTNKFNDNVSKVKTFRKYLLDEIATCRKSTLCKFHTFTMKYFNDNTSNVANNEVPTSVQQENDQMDETSQNVIDEKKYQKISTQWPTLSIDIDELKCKIRYASSLAWLEYRNTIDRLKKSFIILHPIASNNPQKLCHIVQDETNHALSNHDPDHNYDDDDAVSEISTYDVASKASNHAEIQTVLKTCENFTEHMNIIKSNLSKSERFMHRNCDQFWENANDALINDLDAQNEQTFNVNVHANDNKEYVDGRASVMINDTANTETMQTKLTCVDQDKELMLFAVRRKKQADNISGKNLAQQYILTLKSIDPQMAPESKHHELEMAIILDNVQCIDETLATVSTIGQLSQSIPAYWSISTSAESRPIKHRSNQQQYHLKNDIKAIAKITRNDHLINWISLMQYLLQSTQSIRNFGLVDIYNSLFNMEITAHKMALISEQEVNVLKYLIAYLQTLHAIQLHDSNPHDDTSRNYVIRNFTKLSTRDILNHAQYYFEGGQFILALKYMSLLQGISQKLAMDWFQVICLLFEVRQAAITQCSDC